MDRRKFLKTGAAAAAVASFDFPALARRVKPAKSSDVRLKVGVLSDVHVQNAESRERFKKALEYYKAQKVDAVMIAGDLTEYGQRDGVVVIRNDGTQTTYHHLNLADTQLFNSPYFYLQQNDVVYVAPNRIRIDNSKYNQNNAYKLSVISTIVSAVSVVASLVIALAVK